MGLESKELIYTEMHQISFLQKYGPLENLEREKILKILWNMNRILNLLPEDIQELEIYDYD